MVKYIDFLEDTSLLDEYSHLIEYQQKPADLPQEYENFRPRDTFPTGQLLCGDLIVNEDMTKQLEMHPFPEWVVQLIRLDTKEGQVDGQVVCLSMSKKELKKLGRKDWGTRVDSAPPLSIVQLKSVGEYSIHHGGVNCRGLPFLPNNGGFRFAAYFGEIVESDLPQLGDRAG